MEVWTLQQGERAWSALGLGPIARELRPLAIIGALVDGTGAARALVGAHNPLDDQRGAIASIGWDRVMPRLPIVLRSGWTAPGSERPAWLPRVSGGLHAFCDLAAGWPSDAPVWLWPAFDHVLSDVPGVRAFFERRGTERFGLVLDAASMLAPSMIPDAEDHVGRIMEAFGSHRATRVALMGNLEPAAVGDATGSMLAPVHRGVLSSTMLAAALRRWVAPAVPVALLDDDVPAQVAALERGRGGGRVPGPGEGSTMGVGAPGVGPARGGDA